MADKNIPKSFEQLLQENKTLKEHQAGADETRRKWDAMDLMNSKRLLNTVLDNVNSGVALIDETGKFAVVNPLFLKLFGLSEDASIKNVNDQNWSAWQVFNEHGNLLHVDDHPVRKAALTGKRVDQQLIGLILPTGGEIIWMLVSAEPLYKDNGEIEYIICTYTDITRIRKADQLLKLSLSARKLAEDSLVFQSQLLSNVNDAVFSSDLNYKITYWNKAAEEMFGWKKEEALGKNSGELLKPKVEGTSRDKERSKLRRAGHWEGETQYIRKDGTYFCAEVKSIVLTDENGKDSGNVVAVRDITRRKNIEAALLESEQRYHQMFDQHHAVGLLIEPESGEIIDANSAALKFYGYTYEQLCSLKIQEINLLPPDEVEEERKKALTEQRNYFVFPHRLASGEMRWVEVYSSPLFSNGRQLLYSIIHDITSRKNAEAQRKKAEEDLKKSEGRFRLALRNAQVGVALQDTNLVYTWAYNQKSRSPEEIIGKTDADLFAPEDLEWIIPIKKSVLETGKEIDVEKWLTINGTRFYLGIHYEPIFDSSKTIIGIGASTIDLTNRKLIEDALRESEERYHNLFSIMPSGVAVYEVINDGKDSDGKDFIFKDMNPAGEKIDNVKRSEIIGKSLFDFFPNVREMGLTGVFQRVWRTGVPEFFPVTLYKDNRLSLWIVNYVWKLPSGELVALFEDITNRKKVEEKLVDSENRFRNLVKKAPTAIYEVDFSTRKFISVNDAMCELSGYSKEELLAMDSLDLLVEESKDLFISRISEINKGKPIAENVEYKVRAKDGHYVDAVLSMKFNNNEEGIAISATVVGHDITERKKAERELLKTTEALKESEMRFRTLAESIPDLIVRFDKDLRLLYANEAVLKRTNMLPDNLIGKTPFEYTGGSPSAINWEKVAKEVLKTGQPRRIEQANIWQNIPLTYDSLLVPEKDEHGRVTSLVAISRDITEMKKAENILRDSEQRLKYHLENSPLAVVEWDKDFRIIQWSSEAEKIFGIEREKVLGVRIDKLNIIFPEDIPIVEKTSARLLSGRELKVVSQNRNITKSGEILDCIWYNSVLLDENGEMSSVLSLVEDVTLLRKTERELLSSQENYKELVTNAKSMILKFDNEANFTFINDYALQFFGYEMNELLGKSVMMVVPKKESTGRDLDKMVENIIENPDDYSVNVNENIKKNGEKVWVEWHNKALFNSQGEKAGHIAIGVDITKRKIAQENLKDSERKLKSVLNATLESIYMFDTEGKICMVNSTGIKRLKRNSESEIIGHHFSEFMSPDIAKRRQKMHDEIIKTGKPHEYEDVRENRTYHHSFSPVLNEDKVQFIVTYSSDITERKNAEHRLKLSEVRLRSIAESLTTMISITRMKDSVVLFANEPYLKAYGFTIDDVIGKKDPDIFVNPDDKEIIKDILKEKEYVNNRELKVKRADGSTFWIITSIRKISYMGDISFIASSFDISETKQTQEELIRLNRTLNAHSKSSQAMMHSTDEFSYLNEVCKIIIEDCGHKMVWVGYTQNDEEKTVSPVAYYGFDKGYIDQMKVTWDDSAYGRGPTGTAIRTCRPCICKDMLSDPRFEPWREAAISRGFASSLVLPLMLEGKAFGAVSIYSKEIDAFSDLEIDLLNDLVDDLAHGISYIRLEESERAAARAIKESESKLKELIVTKDKFFNIVAHDLKNPFTSLLGSSELLYDNINQMTTENVKKLALILNDSAKSGFAILQNLLDWSRSQTGMIRFCPTEINLRMIIDENIDNLNLQTSNKEIKMWSELKTDLIITADKNLINTVLRNLLSNAVKFTHKNGKIKIAAASRKNEVILSVIDSGIGMSPEKIDQLFKLENALSMPGTEKEQGTGLGLRLCKEFTELMGGRIWAESDPGKGSKFSFTIPVNEGRRD